MWRETRDRELVLLALEAGLPMLWSAEGGGFIEISYSSHKTMADRRTGRWLVWCGDEKELLADWPEWRDGPEDYKLDTCYGDSWREHNG